MPTAPRTALHPLPPRHPDVTPNARGLATRRKVQLAFLTLLQTTAWRDMTIVDVAKLAEVSPATVYQYHAHIDDLALATADRLESEKTAFPPHFDRIVTLLRFENSTDME